MSGSRYEILVKDSLKAAGAVLERQRKHHVWRFPDGSTWVHPSTASDMRAWQNNWSDLRKKLGMVDETRGAAGERREKAVRTHTRPVARAVLSSGPVACLSGLESLRQSLMAVVRRPNPKHECCYPMERRLVLQTPLTTWMRRWM